MPQARERTATLIYDGDCGICGRSVAFMSKRDRHKRFEAVPFQAEEAILILESVDRTRADAARTVVLLRRGRSWDRSAAVVRVLWRLRFPWPFVGTLLWFIPKPLRDAGYRYVERNRGRWGVK